MKAGLVIYVPATAISSKLSQIKKKLPFHACLNYGGSSMEQFASILIDLDEFDITEIVEDANDSANLRGFNCLVTPKGYNNRPDENTDRMIEPVL